MLYRESRIIFEHRSIHIPLNCASMIAPVVLAYILELCCSLILIENKCPSRLSIQLSKVKWSPWLELLNEYATSMKLWIKQFFMLQKPKKERRYIFVLVLYQRSWVKCGLFNMSTLIISPNQSKKSMETLPLSSFYELSTSQNLILLNFIWFTLSAWGVDSSCLIHYCFPVTVSKYQIEQVLKKELRCF